MFDIGFTELLLLAVVGLLVLGPERLPEAARTFGVMVGKLRRSFYSIRNEVQRELEMDEIRTRLEKERQKMGLDQIRESWEEFARQSGQDLNQLGSPTASAPASTPAEIDAPTGSDATAKTEPPAEVAVVTENSIGAESSSPTEPPIKSNAAK